MNRLTDAYIIKILNIAYAKVILVNVEWLNIKKLLEYFVYIDIPLKSSKNATDIKTINDNNIIFPLTFLFIVISYMNEHIITKEYTVNTKSLNIYIVPNSPRLFILCLIVSFNVVIGALVDMNRSGYNKAIADNNININTINIYNLFNTEWKVGLKINLLRIYIIHGIIVNENANCSNL